MAGLFRDITGDARDARADRCTGRLASSNIVAEFVIGAENGRLDRFTYFLLSLSEELGGQ